MTAVRDTPPPEAEDLRALVDLERYPLDAPASAHYREAVGTARAALSDDGCCVLRGFLRPSAMDALQRQTLSLVPHAHVNDIRSNPYSTQDDPSLPEDHPVRTFMERTNAFVPKSAIPEHTGLRRLYHHPAFQRFVSECVNEPVIHEYADPFAGLVINVLKPGCQHPWHYDANEFIVSTLVQHAEEGGVFEYWPHMRCAHDENYDTVGRCLRGEDRSGVRALRLQPGDLQLFRGRFALHRVTRVHGSQPRLTAIFAYADEPGVVSKPERARQLFGRVTTQHLAEGNRSRKDGLVD